MEAALIFFPLAAIALGFGIREARAMERDLKKYIEREEHRHD